MNEHHILEKKISSGVYIIAEIGINHCGKLDKAIYLIDQAVRCGADAVKFQTFNTGTLVRQDEIKMPYQIRSSENAETQFEMLKKVELDRKSHVCLMDHCAKRNIDFISTPYDTESADMLVELGVKILKVASTDTNNLPFLRYLKSLDVPLIISTGVTEMWELVRIIEIFKVKPSAEVALLHCVSNYPAPLEDLNLHCILYLETVFGYPVGFSDHSDSIDVGAYAVAAGAKIVEKHFTFDKSAPGPDHKSSLVPDEFTQYVEKVRTVERCLGQHYKHVAPSERKIKNAMQKSIVARNLLKKGTVLDESNLWTMRPANGISPLYFDEIVGKKLNKNKKRFEPIKWSDLDEA